MNGVTVPNATHGNASALATSEIGLKVRRMILGTGLQRLMMILLHT
jgi:O-phosphoseryl-tRNA(Cys) synthetase